MDNDLISRSALLEGIDKAQDFLKDENGQVEKLFRPNFITLNGVRRLINNAPALDTSLSDDDLATIRIILNAHIGCLCNNGQHTQALEIEAVRDRLFNALHEKTERLKGEWISVEEKDRRDSETRGVTVKTLSAKRPYICSLCGDDFNCRYNFCPTCGTDMRGVKK